MPDDFQPPSDPPVRSTECYAAAIARLREMADENESTIKCSVGMNDERKNHLYQEINICRTAAQWLEEDSAA